MCTEPPVINGPIGTGTVTIGGTWTASTLSGAITIATITVYKNGVFVGSVSNVNSGSTWSLASVSAANGDVFTAQAQAVGESMCLLSNSVTAFGCNTSNIPPTSGLSISCISNRGLEGTFFGTNTVKLYFISSTLVTSTLAGPASSSPTFGYNLNNWFYNGVNFNGSQIPSACSGGAPDMTNGTYYVTTIASGSSCESAPVFTCLGLTQTATPTITQTDLYTSNTTVSGTAVSGATVYLWINGQQRATTTATGGAYSFTELVLSVNDVVEVRAIISGSCMSNAVSRTVSCFTNPPLINADKNNQVTAGQPVTGTSSEPVGTTIRVYNASGPVLVATTTVQSGGTWSTATVPFNAVAGTTYYASAQNGSCTVSANSGNVIAANNTSAARCGTISSPVSASATSVSGTLASAVAGTTVNLYLDGELIGTTTTGTTSWTVSSIPATTIYSNGTLTIGVRETGTKEVICAANVKVDCASSPVSPVFTPANTIITANQTVTYTVTNAVAGNFYAISNSSTGQSLGSGKWAATNGNLTLTTDPIPSAGTYTIVIKATNLSGVTVCTSLPSAATIVVNSTLPLNLLSFNGKWVNDQVLLNWETEEERNTESFIIEKSTDGNYFQTIGKRDAAGNSDHRIAYSFTDVAIQGNLAYYRLKMLDKDGKYSYSRIVVMRRAAHSEVKFWPNPFNNNLNISYKSETTSVIEMRVTDVSGKLLITQRFAVNRGNNQLQLLQLQQLSSGTYFVTVTDTISKTITHTKLTKQ